MDKLIFLGTGHAIAYHCYTTSIALTDDSHYFLTDAGGGNGILLQLERAGIGLEKLTDVFVSHAHTDHLLGVIWLIRMVGHSFDRGRTTPLTIYGHAEVLGSLRRVCEELQSSKILSHFDKDIIFRPVESGETCTIGAWPITFFDIGAAKRRQFGWCATLTNGERLGFLGDEPLTDVGLPFVQGVEHLIHEAFCLAADEEIYHPHRISHSTVVDAANNATRAGTRHLILFHGEDVQLDTRKARYSAEARAHFSGTVDVPDDLDIIPLQLEDTHAK